MTFFFCREDEMERVRAVKIFPYMAENLLSDSMQFAKVTDKLQNNYIVLKSIRICYGAKACRK